MESTQHSSKIYVIDLDDTLCKWNGSYESATPIESRIAKVNRLYDDGHTIIIDTARGSVSGKDLYELTKKQVEEWGVKYHQLIVGKKPFRHYYIGDEAINDKDFFND